MAANAKPTVLYDNRMDDGTPAATDTATGYSVLNIRDWRTYTAHKFNAFGTKYITIDCGSAKSADALFIHTHNLFTADADISVESSATGAFAGEETERLSAFTPTDNKAVLKPFTTASARYWRIKFVTAAVAAQMAIVVLGSRLTMEKYISGGFDPDSETISGVSTQSRTGNLLGSLVQYFGMDLNASFRGLTPSWVTSYFKPAWDNHIRHLKPFAWAWDITNHADQVYLVKVPSGFKKSMPYDPVRRSLTLTMEGISEV